MPSYWLAVFVKGFWDSLDYIHQDVRGIIFAVLVLLLTAIWLLAKHGWADAMRHLWRTTGEGIAIAVVAWLVVFAVHVIWEPFHILADANSNLDRVIKEKQQLTMRINGLEAQESDLQMKLNYLATHSPIPANVQLANDAYRLSNDIEMWWDSYGGLSYQPDVISKYDLDRFENAPTFWNPGMPNRDFAWSQFLGMDVNTRFQNRILIMVDDFKRHGILVPDERIEHVNGPIGIRLAIRYLRESAARVEAGKGVRTTFSP